jgi:hypothetical protein
VEIFQLLDDDRSGSLDIDEFIQSVTQITSSDLPIESVRMMKQISLCREDLTDLKTRIETMDARITKPVSPLLSVLPPNSFAADAGQSSRSTRL